MTEPTRQPPPTERIFVAGNTGSGKTTLVEKRYLDKSRRVIILDLTGEWKGRVDETVYSVQALAREIGYRARYTGNKWVIAFSTEGGASEVEQLVNYLLPVPHLYRSPILLTGGATLLVDEVDLIAPMGPPKRPIRTLYRRSRHVGLSVISTTQRPGNVAREVSAQSTQAIALRLSEPRDQVYMADLMSWSQQSLDQWRRWVRQNPHGGYWKNLLTGEARWIAESGALYLARHADGAQPASRLRQEAEAQE